MKGYIGINQHKIKCIIGIHPKERREEQEIFIDLKVEVDISRPALSDNIRDAVDYVLLADLCTRIAIEGRYQLLETFASHALEAILSRFDISWASIQVNKPSALKTAALPFVYLERYKHGE